MIVEKKQTDSDNFKLNWHFFAAAREAFMYILRHEQKGKKILLPAYIGYSSKEGSGVFDPVSATGAEYDFYSLDRSLNIDVRNVADRIHANKGNILLLIHYFGFRDPHLDAIKKMARSSGMVIIEDFAHAFYTFWLHPLVDFDYAIFSTHKLFPVETGGALLSSRPIERQDSAIFNYCAYDIPGIIRRRMSNYRFILKGLDHFSKKHDIEILRRRCDGCVPQTFPLLLRDGQLRDRLYFALNDAGFGAVSLYHQLITQIPDTYEAERDISSRILNLPVHQDADEGRLRGMLQQIRSIVRDEGETAFGGGRWNANHE